MWHLEVYYFYEWGYNSLSPNSCMIFLNVKLLKFMCVFACRQKDSLINMLNYLNNNNNKTCNSLKVKNDNAYTNQLLVWFNYQKMCQYLFFSKFVPKHCRSSALLTVPDCKLFQWFTFWSYKPFILSLKIQIYM